MFGLRFNVDVLKVLEILTQLILFVCLRVEAAPSLPADRVQTPHVSAQYQPPPSLPAAPPHSRSRAVRTGKENICGPGGRGGGGEGEGEGDPYEAFARTERSRRDRRRPEWNTQR